MRCLILNLLKLLNRHLIQPVNDIYQYNTGYRAGKRKDFWGWLRKPKGSGGPLPFGLVKLGSFFIPVRMSSSPSAPVELPVSDKYLRSGDPGQGRRYFRTQTPGLALVESVRDKSKSTPLNVSTPALVALVGVVVHT